MDEESRMIQDNVLYGLADTLGMEIFILPGDKLMVQGSAYVDLFIADQLRLTIEPKALDYRLNKKSREFVSLFHLRADLYMIFLENRKTKKRAIVLFDGSRLDKNNVLKGFTTIQKMLLGIAPFAKATFSFIDNSWKQHKAS